MYSMSCVLYYSNYCTHSKELITLLAKSKLKEEVHFICIDKRTKLNGATYILLENGQQILLPPNITCVPSLLLLNRGHRVITGQQIKSHLIKQEQQINMQSTQMNGEPLAFSMGQFGSIMSDNYSFLDQSPDEMSAKGSGGLRQMHNYVLLNQNDAIETPPDNWSPDKVGGDVSLDKLIAQRNKDIPQQPPRM